ncbi:hypothetical protein Trydic_g7251 [Trypoxylus dichotomus]
MRTLKALEKYQVELEIQGLKRARSKKIGPLTGDTYGAMGMYIIDTDERKPVPTTTSAMSLPDGDTKNNFILMLIRFFQSMYIDSKCDLKWKEFMTIIFCLQVTLPYLMRHIAMVTTWGAIPVLVVQTIITSCVGMPIYMILMFLGNFSRKSYIKFWECVPAMKGVAYAIVLTTTQHELINVTIAGMALNYLWSILSGSTYPWKDCQFSRSVSDCYDKPVENYTVPCCKLGTENCTDDLWSAGVFKYASYDYLISNQLRLDHNPSRNIGKGMPVIFTVYAAFIWLLVFLSLMIGIKKYHRIFTSLTITVGAIFFGPMLAIVVYNGDQEMFPGLSMNYSVFFNYTFLMAVAKHSLHREMAGDIVTYSSLAAPGLSTGANTICIYALKMLCLLMVTMWISMAASLVSNYYRIADSSCLDTGGFTLLFAIIPDALTWRYMPRLSNLIYFTMLFSWSFFGTVYNFTSFQMALMEEYPRLITYKGLVSGSICIIAASFNILIMQGNILTVTAALFGDAYTHAKITVIFCTVIGMFYYTLNRIENDYQFTYGQKLNVFWIHGLKMAMLLLTIISIFFYVTKFTEGSIALSDMLVLGTSILPIVLGALIIFIRYKSGLKKTFANPDPRWGPMGFTNRISRSKFDPKRALRYKISSASCNHPCLLYSNSLRNEIIHCDEQYRDKYNIHVD